MRLACFHWVSSEVEITGSYPGRCLLPELHLPYSTRSTIELILTDRLDFIDGIMFPSICDVIRNLSGMVKMIRPDIYSYYYDMPQNYNDSIGGEYLYK